MSNQTINNIGQHFIVGINSPNPDKGLLDLIRNYNIGGVLFLGKNYSSIDELADAVNMMQASSTKVPLLTTVDHEGGRVQRFKEPFTRLPAFRDMVKNRNPKEIFEIFAIIAQELLACGINMNLAPVADMTAEIDGVIGDRSIGTDLHKVEETISAAIRGMIKGGILCCVKHFPGHGCVTQDSHIDLPVSDKTIEELLSYEISPFKKATKAGVQAIMTAHILFKNEDSLPSSLSPKFIEEIIRKGFRFTKLVITDDISMGAITKHYDPKEAAKLALHAGNDMIIYSSSDTAILAETIEATAKEAENDQELMNKISASQSRIVNIKAGIIRQNISSTSGAELLANSPLKTIFNA